ncbi:hypothetical protein [Hyphomicrobium sp. CS1GBMeth3]|uniref:hypothetical protein n=1 Tax=Hyphomicrobium sp. CS1GBMeth3 TaxID=1892845 RepID=UPI0011147069|nr:hypothetical protein [Hyphomicrobium sp. CS1GBMeth3]
MVIVVQMIIGAVIFYLTQQSDMTTRVVSALAPFLLLPVWYTSSCRPSLLKWPKMQSAAIASALPR